MYLGNPLLAQDTVLEEAVAMLIDSFEEGQFPMRSLRKVLRFSKRSPEQRFY